MTDTYRGEDIDRIAFAGEFSILFMRDNSVFIVSVPDMDIVAYATEEDIANSDTLAVWLSNIYFFLSEPVSQKCSPDCTCRDSEPPVTAILRIYS